MAKRCNKFHYKYCLKVMKKLLLMLMFVGGQLLGVSEAQAQKHEFANWKRYVNYAGGNHTLRGRKKDCIRL